MIKLTSILTHLPENNVRELEVVTQRLIDTGKVEIVILFGSYARGNFKEKKGRTKGKKSDYDILAISSDINSRNALRSELRAKFNDIGSVVQLIAEPIAFVNSNLEERQYFFTDIKREGKILFDSGKYRLATPKAPSPIRRRKIAEADYAMWFTMAKDFYGQYRHAYSDSKFRIASFNLQQTVEMCYTAIEMVFTHYNPFEHNLEVLRNRALEFDSRVKAAMPCETDREQELFDYLNYAYIGGRYRSEREFPVTIEQLEYWSTEVEKLLDLTQTICIERIECLKQIEPKATT